MHDEPIPVPLRDRTGTIIGFAVLDQADEHLATHRWYMDSDPGRALGKAYARRNVQRDGRTIAIYLHREVVGLQPGDPRQCDHINGITLDCRRANLRILTHAQNGQNLRKRTNTTSRFRGVTWDKSREKWMATGALPGGRRRTLGRFDSEEEAGAVAAAWRAERLPFSEEPTALHGKLPPTGGSGKEPSDG